MPVSFTLLAGSQTFLGKIWGITEWGPRGALQLSPGIGCPLEDGPRRCEPEQGVGLVHTSVPWER